MSRRTLVIASVILSGSVLAAAAQSVPGSTSDPVSPASHCLDQATGQAKLKTDAPSTAGSGADESSGLAASGLTSSSPSGAGSTASSSTVGDSSAAVGASRSGTPSSGAPRPRADNLSNC
jgi:hypothetical protein